MRILVTTEIFLAFLRLGLTSFGGPVAHLAYFRREFVQRRGWLDEHAYADLVSLCQMLPGPASSQVGMGLGLLRGGVAGSLAAWLGFTLPSALALVLFGLALRGLDVAPDNAALHGLRIVAVAVVAQAVWAMGKTACPDRPRAVIALLACAASLLRPGSVGQFAIIAGAGVFGALGLPAGPATPALRPFAVRLGKRAGGGLLAAFALLLLALPALAHWTQSAALDLFSRCYRAGALVFGGGHIVLPMLQVQLVGGGVVSNDVFLAGYGAAQAVPGPLFTFAAYLGALSRTAATGWAGATIALVGVFLPGYLLVIGLLPLWERARRHAAAARALQGINAAVVGLLLAALYTPVGTSAIGAPADLALALVAFLFLTVGKLAPWLVVVGGAALATLIDR